MGGLEFDWETVGEQEKRELGAQMMAALGGLGKGKRGEDGGDFAGEEWFKVDWERVPELVEGRRVFIRRGKAYVPGKEQLSFVMAEFGARLEKALEVSVSPYFLLQNSKSCLDGVSFVRKEATAIPMPGSFPSTFV